MFLKISSLLITALLFPLSSFAQHSRPSISTTPASHISSVEIIYIQEKQPTNAEKIGQLKLNSGGIFCGIAGLLAEAQYQAGLKGGNAIYVTNVIAPAPGEYCFTIEAEIYKLKEPYLSSPNFDYPFENVISTKADTSTLVEIMPQFPGNNKGMLNFFSTNLRYPESAFMHNGSGKVIVTYVIDPTGKPTEISIVEGVRFDLDQEVVRVISQMPEWSPGYQNGKPVPVRLTYPINFTIKDKASKRSNNKKHKQ